MLNIRLSRPPGATRRRSTSRTAMWRHVKRRAFLLASPKVAVFLVIYRSPVFPGRQDRMDHRLSLLFPAMLPNPFFCISETP